MPAKQARRWCGTYFSEENIDPGEAVLDFCNYFCFAEEFSPENNKRHSQWYAFTKKKVAVGKFKTWLESIGYANAHFEIASEHSTHLEASKYIKGPYTKRDDAGNVIKTKPANPTFKEYGSIPLEGHEQTKRDWENVRALARQGRFSEIDAKYDVCFTRNLRFLHQEARRATHLEAPCGYFIYGHSGAGKSYYARALNDHNDEDTYLKNFNKYWCGYANQRLVILEDADPEKCKGLDQELKIWTDRYAFAPENKHGHTGKIRPEKFVITSQYDLGTLFPDKETWWALRRRCILVKCWVTKDGKHHAQEQPRYTEQQVAEEAAGKAQAVDPAFTMVDDEFPEVDEKAWNDLGTELMRFDAL